ncbi:MAG TPA: hypothetical protein ENI32_08055 [Candidatus Syntrophoarchaeum butanivorans]|uniref:Uncharacterized protein n=1 Tax=Candidatus Syntropharchaeum butanivorans TaxID=1839936 RepID=A0A7J2S2Y5_9EURY|nr:hypothetical protein [Candidatus Syntrophoarchaeum butanivorans]
MDVEELKEIILESSKKLNRVIMQKAGLRSFWIIGLGCHGIEHNFLSGFNIVYYSLLALFKQQKKTETFIIRFSSGDVVGG